MNERAGQEAKRSPEQQRLILQRTLDVAVQHHMAGRLPQAENLYQQILQTHPNQSVPLHLLGVIAHQVGKNEIAVDLINKDLAVKPDYAEAHSNLGLALRDLGKLDAAVASFRKALAVKPDYAEAHFNLGFALRDLGELEDAVASFRNALAFKPDYAKAHNSLGSTLQDLGKLDEAVASYRRALAVKQDFAEAHTNLGNLLKELGQLDNAVASYRAALAVEADHARAWYNLGNALRNLGKTDDAVASYRKALAVKPDFAEAHNNLGSRLREVGLLAEAVECHRRAISLNPENDLFWAGFAESLVGVSFPVGDDDLYRDLSRLLERRTVRPSDIARPVINALRHHPDFLPILEATGANKEDIAYGDVAEKLSRIPLFIRILALSPIHVLEIERMLTVVRRAMLKETMDGSAEVFAFSAALALNCFTNEYVFPETSEENEAVEDLKRRIATLMESGQGVPPSFIVALGAYRPLVDFPWARELRERRWPDNVKDVIKRQITEPLEERSLRETIPRVTFLQNPISESVREQYEENPYPRWIKTDVHHRSRAIGDVLTSPPLSLDLGGYVSPENPEILVAGCGTGMHALYVASRYSNANVVAVDLSSNSLSYAKRKTVELGFSNIEYVQGDLMALAELGRSFDLIECVGVLHHLGDPLAGWRILVDLLRPGGGVENRPI